MQDIQTEAYIGIDQDAFTNAEVLRFADRVIESEIVPSLSQLANNYYDAISTLPIITSTSIGERALYSLPFHALGSLTSVTYLTTDGAEVLLTETSEAALAEPGRFRFVSIDGNALYYYFRGSRIGLLPNPTNGHLRIRYSAKPFPLNTDAAEFREITARALQGGTLERITVSAAVPAGWTTADTFQVLSAAPPHVPVELIPQPNVSAVGATTIDVTQALQWPWTSATVRGSEQPGDFVISGFASPIVQLPHEAYAALVMRVAGKLMNTRGDTSRGQVATGEYSSLMGLITTTLGDRNKSSSKAFINRSSDFHIRGRRRRSL